MPEEAEPATRVNRVPYRECPLCRCPRLEFRRLVDCTWHPLYDPRLPGVMRWLSCSDCGHVFVDGYFDAYGESVLFARANPNQTPRWSFDHNERLLTARIVEAVARFRPRLGGRWLDVGFGNGMLVTVAAEFGFDVVGLDTRTEHVDLLRSMGFEAHSTNFMTFDSTPFDVISMADVLEHMPFPHEALAAAARLLVPGGTLFVSMPNLECFGWRARDLVDQNPYWAELEHLHNFGRTRLYSLLAEHGFTPRAYGVSERYFVGMEVIAEKTA